MTSNRILTSYFTIAGVYTFAAALIWGVNTLFLLDAGLDIFEVFIVNAAFTAGSFVFEIPTGVLADTRGRRTSLLLSVVILFISTLAYVGAAEVGGGVLLFSLVSVIMGLGFTFYSGAVDAWLVDALHYTGYDGQLDHVFARGSMVTGTAMLVGTVGEHCASDAHSAWGTCRSTSVAKTVATCLVALRLFLTPGLRPKWWLRRRSQRLCN